jgi:hypothetical protein
LRPPAAAGRTAFAPTGAISRPRRHHDALGDIEHFERGLFSIGWAGVSNPPSLATHCGLFWPLDRRIFQQPAA